MTKLIFRLLKKMSYHPLRLSVGIALDVDYLTARYFQREYLHKYKLQGSAYYVLWIYIWIFHFTGVQMVSV